MNELFQWFANLFKEARCWAIVAPWERAVRIRAGKHVRLWEPGLHFRIPYLDDVRLVNTRLRIAIAPSQTITTSDGRALTVATMIGFRIADPLAAMLRLQNPEDCIASVTGAEVAGFVSAHRGGVPPVPELEAAVVKALAPFLDHGFDIEFVRVVDYAAVRTFRLLQEQWRTHTGGTQL